MDHDAGGRAVARGSVSARRRLCFRIARQSPPHDRASRTRGADPHPVARYRLAPERPFPAALEDVIAGYHFLLSQGFDPKRIAVAGESAGGGLAIAMLVSLRDRGFPLPACTWCSSPWVDLEAIGGSMTAKASVDPLIQKAYLMELAAAYLKGADPRMPLASPLYADLRGLPPMLIQVGSAETLLDDSVRLAGVAGPADVRVRLEVWPDMIHAWHLFYPQLADGRRALAQVGVFIRSMLG